MFTEIQLPLLFVLFLNALNNLNAVIISKAECGPPFSCPDKCDVHWEGACPAECVCSSQKACPDVECPALPPKCIIFTKHDGCQDCACEEPFQKVHIQNMKKLVKSDAFGDNFTTESVPSTTKIRITEPPLTFGHFHMPTVWPLPELPASVPDVHLRCSEAQRAELVRNFGALDEELDEIGQLSGASMLFPPIFAFTKAALKRRCELYNQAHQRTSFDAKRNCFNDFYAYYRPYYSFSFACGSDSGRRLGRFFDCLQALRFDPRIVACEARLGPLAVLSGQQPGQPPQQAGQQDDRRGACLRLRDLVRCAQRLVLRACGLKGWTTYTELLAVAVKPLSRSCRIDARADAQDEARLVLSPDLIN